MRKFSPSTAGGFSQRQLRFGEMIRHALADILARESFSDPMLQNVSITISEVRPSPDLKHARVYCMPLGGENATNVIAALNAIAKPIRGRLGKDIESKFTPTLHFVTDTSYENARRIDGLLAEAESVRPTAMDGQTKTSYSKTYL